MKNKEKSHLINPVCRASDVILSNPRMVRLIQAIGIPLGFGDVTIEQLCMKNGMSGALFTALCNMLLHTDYSPDVSKFSVDDAQILLRYLKSTHSYYRNMLLPQLHSNVHKIASLCRHETSLLVNRFFDDYDVEMEKHISHEENVVFAQIEEILDGSMKPIMMDHPSPWQHDDVETKIEDFMSIIAKYLPESCNCQERYLSIIQMMDISEDLHFHARIEDDLLFPLISRLISERITL